jgi:hypothetical protein
LNVLAAALRHCRLGSRLIRVDRASAGSLKGWFVKSVESDQIVPRSRQPHDRAIIVDTHVDTTQRLVFVDVVSVEKMDAMKAATTAA